MQLMQPYCIEVRQKSGLAERRPDRGQRGRFFVPQCVWDGTGGDARGRDKPGTVPEEARKRAQKKGDTSQMEVSPL